MGVVNIPYAWPGRTTMSTADLLGTPPHHDTTTADTTTGVTDTTDQRRRLLRTAGLGGVGAFVAWACQPVLVAVLAANVGADSPDFADLETMRYVGGLEAVVFSLVGVAMLTLVLATWRVMCLSRPEASVLSTVGLAMGLVAAAAWFWVAGDSASMYTSVGAGLPDITTDPAVQRAVIDRTYLDVTGGLLVFAVGCTGWFVMLATAGRRAGLVGRPLAVLLGLLALVPAYQVAVPFAAPWPLITFVLGCLVLGVALLVKSRR